MSSESIHARGRARAIEKIANTYFKGASHEFMQRFFPSLAAAYDSYMMRRLERKKLDRMRAAAAYPVTYMTQPVMMQMAFGAEDPYVDMSEGYPGQ